MAGLPFPYEDYLANPKLGHKVLTDLFRGSAGQLPAVRVTRAATQPIPNVTDTSIAFAAADYDLPGTPSMWDVAAPTQLVAPVAGIYTAMASGEFNINASGERIIWLQSNGVVLAHFNGLGNSTWLVGASVGADLLMAAGDAVQLFVYQNSGGSLGFGGSYLTSMSLRCVRPS